jgi:teichuronic acid exporter
MGLSILAVTVFYGVYAIALGQVLSGIISTFINSYPNKRLLDYSYREQWNDIIPSMLLSLVMGVAIFSFKLLGLSALITVIVQVCLGVVLYAGMAWLFKIECFTYLIMAMKDILSRERRYVP